MEPKTQTTEEAEAITLAREIADKSFAWLKDHHGWETVTPALVKQSMLAVMAAYKERDLEEGVDYRIEAEGTCITITPISSRCIEWFAPAHDEAHKDDGKYSDFRGCD